MEWVEAQGKSVEVAVAAALAELGLESADEAEIEVLQEPTVGFLGLGGKEAIVKVTRKPQRRRRGRGRGGKGRSKEATAAKEGDGRRDEGRRDDRRNDERRSAKPQSAKAATKKPDGERPEPAPIEEQADVAREFLEGLIASFGLEGEVVTRIEDDILWIDVRGGQTEALVGPKGAVLQAVHELTRTVVQRKTFGAPRMRIDIAGYAERRREALRIYTRRLADRILATGGEVMLEPMNAADRKVVHDTVVEIDGVRSYSEGEEPNRAVVLSLEDGWIPTGATQGDEDGEDRSAEDE